MRIHNKTLLFVGFVLMVVPNWIPQYSNIYLYLMQLLGFILIILSFRKPKAKKAK